ncbi:unnamed protein product (macronuclear) [Paramecium tetraurelia]|uniref:Aldehyde dehydrogenase domain-containing protein n=1 Tax=Paramecium tetraurelia TaxID=5888 RepID=A0CTF2_PARTE|nr:uncharacterized protein GSPATT00010303001 [Paramecium tetraurelia]CAK74069.1 unnamed protein product [Paramecium tetraurelia]|eukprot:XP_001441466.1 hypothetical protein (macronuclear) [Paramecium tetraurelia strain d4-2]
MNTKIQEKISNPNFIQNTFPLNVKELSENSPYRAMNFINGIWKCASNYLEILDPLNGDKFILVPNNLTEEEINEYRDAAIQCPKSGLHNPLKNPDRYNLYGEIFHRVSFLLGLPQVEDYFVHLIQRVAPKSDIQARGEVKVTQRFLMNFSGDQCRFLTRSFNVSGDVQGQQSSGYRFPYGHVAIIAPFNFPLEIPALQMMGALLAGNRLTIKGDQRVSVVLEMFLRLLHLAGLPPTDCDLIHCDGPQMESLLKKSNFRLLQFTGSSGIAERLCNVMNGKIKIEDAGFDWKILGPDVIEFDYVAYQSDQDAYAFSGQKCSAQSILFAHKNWVQAGILDKIKLLAEQRSLQNLTICPILTWNNQRIQTHLDKLLAIQGAKVLFGGKPINEQHKIPECYGSYLPTAVYIPLQQIKENFELVTTEVFGPFQVVTEYENEDHVIEILENIPHNLTAGVVSNDIRFVQKILANTINGVTYAGIKARTTGAPQNHWFGPCGDPRGTGIGSPEAIVQTWTTHREIIMDIGTTPKSLTQS